VTDARVTIITPTLVRRADKLRAAVASVRGQTLDEWEHFIICDGPPAVENLPDAWDFPVDNRTRGCWLGAHHATPGHWNRVLGGLLASTPYIAYLDDDNTWRPRHLELAVHALDKDPGLGFVHTLMQRPTSIYPEVLGHTRLLPGHCVNYIDASMLVHRRELMADIATWDPHMAPPHLRYALDGVLVDAWLHAGVRYAQIPEITVDYSGVGYWLDGGGAVEKEAVK
jgi:Glycosyl transferase family 2